MKTLESGLIKDQIVYPCKYYELETMCQKIVTEYCHESVEHTQEFTRFALSYQTFRPYFDFVVGYLGYIVMNPELEKETFIKGEDSHFYLCDENGVKLSNGFSFGMGDDITLNKYPMSMDPSTFHDCLIDGNCNHLLSKNMVGHIQLFQQIANNLFISCPDVCEEYLSYPYDLGSFVQRYYPLLRFQAHWQGPMILTRCIYREKNMTPQQNLFMQNLLYNRYTYPSFLNPIERELEEYDAKDYSRKLQYEKVGELNEYRRF